MAFKQIYIKQIESVNYPFSRGDFDLSHWHSQKDSIALTGGRGASQKIVIQGEFYVLRQYLRGGLIAHVLQDLYLWTGLKRSRPFREQQVIQHALQNNLPVPEVVAFCAHKKGLFYRAFIISRFVYNVGTLASFLYDNELPDNQWLELGKLIRRFHQAGIFHADLNANNILIDKDGKFTLIDFDKAQVISPLGGLAEKNLHRLLRSLHKIQGLRLQNKQTFNFSMDQWQQLLAGYN